MRVQPLLRLWMRARGVCAQLANAPANHCDMRVGGPPWRYRVPDRSTRERRVSARSSLWRPRMPLPPRILLRDDHDSVRAVVAHLPARLRPTAPIVEAADGAATLRLVVQHPLDLTIADHQLPRMH